MTAAMEVMRRKEYVRMFAAYRFKNGGECVDRAREVHF